MARSQAFRTVTAVMGAALILSGCAPEADAPPEEAIVPDTADVVTDTAEFVNGEWVQDLWVYESIATINEEGDTVQLHDDILEALTTPDTSVDLPHDGTLHLFDLLSPSIVNGDGNTRADVDVIAGVLEHDGERGLAVLATPHADSAAPIGLDDSVEVDLTFLGDKLQPGDPLIMDYVFLQARPAADEPELTGADLLAERIDAGRAFTHGGEVDGVQKVIPYTQVLGTAVQGSTRLSMPGKGKISEPGLKGIGKGLRQCLKRPGLSCIRKYHKSAAGGFEDSMNLIDCNLGGAGCTPPPPPTFSPPADPYPWCGLGCVPPARTHGDPHLLSFDGRSHDMQGVGEYVLTTGPDLDLHVRTAPVTPSNRTVSSVWMVAAQIDGHVIVVDAPGGEFQVRIDGDPTPHNDGYADVTRVELDEVTVFIDSGSIIISAPHHEIGVVITNSGERLSLSTYLPESATGYTGLLGDNDGDPDNDLRTRSGTVIEDTHPRDSYYEDFANSWRVSPSESLLHYEVGETTETHTDVTFPDLGTPSPTMAQLARGEAVCRAAGIEDPVLLAECAFDYAVTGDVSFVESAQQVALTNLSIASVLTRAGASGEGGSAAGDITQTTPSGDPWRTTMSRFKVGERVQHVCPRDGSKHTVWGGEDGVYTDDSSICTAAVHAGLITLERGGTVTVTKTEGLSSYPGSTHNGVTTREWGSWPGSFVFD